MQRDAERGVDWVHLPVIATVARLLCRELTLQNEYLLLENRTLKSKVPGRLRFTDEERRCLSEAALAMGRSLMKEVVSIVKPETILAWQRRLEQKKMLWLLSSGLRGRPPCHQTFAFVLRIEGLARLEDSEDDTKQLAHAGDESRFGTLALS